MPACFNVDTLQPGGYVALVVIVGIAFMIRWVHRQHDFPGKRVFLLTNIGMIVWLLAALAEIQSATLGCKVFWAMQAWTGIAFVPTAWAVFLVQYAFGRQSRMSRLELGALALGPVLIALMAATNPLHGLLYGPATRMEVIGGVEAVVYDHGPLFYGAAAYLYLLMLFSTGVVVVGAFRSGGAHRTYFLMLTFVTCVPMVSNLSYVVFGFTLFGFDPTPFAFSVVLFLFTVLIFTNRLFDITTVARDLLFFNARNPVLVVDAKGIVVGLNQAAQDLFPDRRIGTPIARWPHFGSAAVPGRTLTAQEYPETLTLSGRHLAVQITPITQALGAGRPASGMVILLNDLTEIAQKNAALEAALRLNARRLEEIESLRDDLQRQILLDPLTGLHNRRGLSETFARLTGGASARGLVVALLDIDHFKSINDRFGHAAGDRILRDFARALRVHVRPGLPVFRIGGEEFLVIFPDATLAEIEEFLESFRTSLATGQFVRVSDPERIGFSAGLGQWPRDGAGLDAVMKSADDRLYMAKMAGRGCTVSRDAQVRHAASEGGG